MKRSSFADILIILVFIVAVFAQQSDSTALTNDKIYIIPVQGEITLPCLLL